MKWRIVSAIIYLICALMDIPMGVIHKNLWEITCGVLFSPSVSTNSTNGETNEAHATHPPTSRRPPRPGLNSASRPIPSCIAIPSLESGSR